MKQRNYTCMSDTQLKQHIIQNKGDQDALTTYVERRIKQARPVIANVKDKDFDERLKTAIAQQLDDSL